MNWKGHKKALLFIYLCLHQKNFLVKDDIVADAHFNVVSFRFNYHLHCMFDNLTSSIPGPLHPFPNYSSNQPYFSIILLPKDDFSETSYIFFPDHRIFI